MTDLAFVDNYKEIRKRLNGGIPKPKAVAIVKPTEVVPTMTEETPKPVKPHCKITRLSILKNPAVREYVRRSTILEEGISYREALLKGAEDLPKRVKLIALPILEETNFSWDELFGKDPTTARNSRTPEVIKARWDIFKELRSHLSVSPNQIASWCKMDHTSVLYGLGLLKKSK